MWANDVITKLPYSKIFFLFLKKILFTHFYWSIVGLQCCVHFCYTLKWISYTDIPSLLDLLPYPSPHHVPLLWIIYHHWAELPVLYSRSPLPVSGHVHMSILLSQLEKAMAPHSSTVAWKIPWTEEPGRLQSMGSLRIGHNWATSLSRIGEGNGNLLQCSCLENTRDGGAWWAAIYGVAQSWTRLKWLSSSSSSSLSSSHAPSPLCPYGHSLHLCLYSCPENRSFLPFFSFPHKCINIQYFFSFADVLHSVWQALGPSTNDPILFFFQFSSVAQLCPTLCDPMNRSTPGLPVHHQLPEFNATHVHRVGDAIQPSHPLSFPSPPALNPS